ncbi:Biliverdin reductase B (Flavin reductase (NADPH)) [Seminavis robusta]|uniref:Biliverdin reductase B (Flavin reductase (NADPH)) n=1 Tax=Seminavis robusta TaxID=568900 RepID=A0A9N8DRS1_9STRA|nr:Biliverdin reductase B (Flavin reductase (NADPH)) [Seminavis robusta]|eukprot:Sro235_g094790.1 Biliverdin reductase B (Flavin reductase (NADPH)) (241) ;mRNA; f:63339-64061
MPNIIDTTQKSVLVIGASGRTGSECIRAFAKHQNKPEVHAFCRSPSKLAESDKNLCTSVVQGNAKDEADIEKALRQTKADVVVVSVGGGDSVAKSDIRTVSANAVSNAMKKKEFQHVQAMVVSSIGAGSSSIIVGMGIGMMISFHLRHVLKDHDGQELAFSVPEVKSRTCVVRPTSLVDSKATGKLVYFNDKEKGPSIETDRADLANWVTNQICGTESFVGKTVNITGVKQTTRRRHQST